MPAWRRREKEEERKESGGEETKPTPLEVHSLFPSLPVRLNLFLSIEKPKGVI